MFAKLQKFSDGWHVTVFSDEDGSIFVCENHYDKETAIEACETIIDQLGFDKKEIIEEKEDSVTIWISERNIAPGAALSVLALGVGVAVVFVSLYIIFSFLVELY